MKAALFSTTRFEDDRAGYASAARRFFIFKVFRLAAGALVLVFLFVTFIWPLATVFERSSGAPLFANYVTVLEAESIRVILWRTLRLAGVVSLCCLLLAYPTALALLGLKPRTRTIVLAAILLPSVTSFLVRTYAWITVLGANGPIVSIGAWFGIPIESFIGTFPGLVAAMTHMLVPLAIFPIYASMRTIKRSDLLAAHSLGARPAEAFVRIFVPQTLSGTISGIILVFIVSLGFFVTPALIGGIRETTVAQLIYMYMNELFNWGRSTSLAVLLLVVVLLLLAAAARLSNVWAAFGLRESRFRGGAGRPGSWSVGAMRQLGQLARYLPFQERPLRLSRIVLVLTLLILILPLLFVFAVSFQPKRLMALPLESLSMRWYEVVLSDWGWIDAILTSLKLAIVAACIATSVGYLMALWVRAAPPFLRTFLTGLCIGPLALPHIVLAVGIYSVFLTLGLTGQFIGVALAHACVGVPFAFINIMNGLASYDHKLDAAAESLGARPLRRFVKIKLPLLGPALASAAAFSFLVSLDELVLTLFVSGIDIRTLPVKMFGAASQNLSPELAAVGSLLILLIVILGAALRAFGPRRGVARHSTDK